MVFIKHYCLIFFYISADGKESGNSAPDHINSIYNQNSYGRYSQDFENAAALMDEVQQFYLV